MRADTAMRCDMLLCCTVLMFASPRSYLCAQVSMCLWVQIAVLCSLSFCYLVCVCVFFGVILATKHIHHHFFSSFLFPSLSLTPVRSYKQLCYTLLHAYFQKLDHKRYIVSFVSLTSFSLSCRYTLFLTANLLSN